MLRAFLELTKPRIALMVLVTTAMGFFFGGTALGFPLVAQHIPSNLKGAGFGLMTSFGYLLSAFLEYLVGAILNRSNPPLTVLEFKIALTPLVFFTLVGWACSWRLKEKKGL